MEPRSDPSELMLALGGRVPAESAGLAVGSWLRGLRSAIGATGVTGGLLFDGEQWLLMLHGRAAEVLALPLLAALGPEGPYGMSQRWSLPVPADAARRPGWRVAYVDTERLAAIHERLDADAAGGFAELSLELAREGAE